MVFDHFVPLLTLNPYRVRKHYASKKSCHITSIHRGLSKHGHFCVKFACVFRFSDSGTIFFGSTLKKLFETIFSVDGRMPSRNLELRVDCPKFLRSITIIAKLFFYRERYRGQTKFLLRLSAAISEMRLRRDKFL